ncbi:MAG: hypothetical protein JWP69_877 [Flaviaesturariibacter sp.]|nr:hypothetical protein [Flaviaesturariibacter sp.]
MEIHPQHIRTDSLKNLYQPFGVAVDVLRLDLLHPVVSGNKWFKLKDYVEEAKGLNKKTILTFGGAYSNHIIATAAACKAEGFASIGIIRGEEPPILSHTLKAALTYGMQLHFVSRSDYAQKRIPPALTEREDDIYIIEKGGFGLKGRIGAESILQYCESLLYTHIIASVGTGTTLAGLITSAADKAKVTGISALKNNHSLEAAVNSLLPSTLQNLFSINHNFHFGGYAKYTPELLEFMNSWYQKTGIPSDFVYTAKLFFAVDNLVKANYFESGSKLLVIHSGGLQGNNSLPPGTLIF